MNSQRRRPGRARTEIATLHHLMGRLTGSAYGLYNNGIKGTHRFTKQFESARPLSVVGDSQTPVELDQCQVEANMHEEPHPRHGAGSHSLMIRACSVATGLLVTDYPYSSASAPADVLIAIPRVRRTGRLRVHY